MRFKSETHFAVQSKIAHLGCNRWDSPTGEHQSVALIGRLHRQDAAVGRVSNGNRSKAISERTLLEKQLPKHLAGARWKPRIKADSATDRNARIWKRLALSGQRTVQQIDHRQ